MVITFVCDVLGPANNGTAIATYNQAKAMEKRGHTVRFVVPDKDKEGVPGFTVVKPINFLILNNYVAKNGVCLSGGRDMKKVAEAIKGSDLVHFNFCGQLSAKTVRLAHKMGIPCTASFHAQAENFTNHVFLMNARLANHLLYKILNFRLFKRVDAIHYPSQFIHDYFRRQTRNKVKGYVISNGIHKHFKKEDSVNPIDKGGKIHVAYTARYSKEKTHKILFKAVRLSKYKNDIVLVLPGAGPLEKKFVKWGNKYCVNPPVLGFHDHNDMVKILSNCDVYCHPSAIDIEPISLLEAISVGLTPVITDSKRSGASSLAYDKKNVFKHGSPKDLAAKMDYWLSHPEEAKENAKKYAGLSEKFDFEDAMGKMEEMFKEVVANYKK